MRKILNSPALMRNIEKESRLLHRNVLLVLSRRVDDPGGASILDALADGGPRMIYLLGSGLWEMLRSSYPPGYYVAYQQFVCQSSAA